MILLILCRNAPTPQIPSDVGLTTISEVVLECEKRVQQLPVADGLLFSKPPCPTSPSVPRARELEAISGLNEGPYALDVVQSVNGPFLRHELWLMSALERLDGVAAGSRDNIRSQRKKAVRQVQAEMDRLYQLRADQWHKQEADQARARYLANKGEVDVVDTGKHTLYA